MAIYSSTLNTILNDRRLTQTIREFERPDNLFLTGGDTPYFPIIDNGSLSVEWRTRFAASGIHLATNMDADIPLRRIPGFSLQQMDAPVWRSRWMLYESDLTKIVHPDQREGRYGEALVDDVLNDGSNITDSTVEYAAWQALAGSLTLRYHDAANITVDYEMPPFLNITPGTAWSDAASDPVTDVMDAVQLLAEMGTTAVTIVFSTEVMKDLVNNTAIRQLYQGSATGAQSLARGQIPVDTFVGLDWMTFDGRYNARAYVATTYTIGNSLVVDDATEIADLGGTDNIIVGPSTHATNPRAINRQGVTSISANTITLDSALADDFEVGDPVTWARRFLPAREVYILPARNTGQRIYEWSVAPSLYGGNVAGKYAVSERLPGHPLKHEIVTGIDGIPIIKQQGHHARLNV